MSRKVKIVCTIGKIREEELEGTIHRFIQAGMDVARINMAHYDVTTSSDREYLARLVKVIRRKSSEEFKKAVAILGDIQGPKVRIKEFLGAGKNRDKVKVNVNDDFILTSQEKIDDDKLGASITYEGDFNFFENIKATAKRDDQRKFKPIEFWFGDGKVILETSVGSITDTSASCQVKVAGELKKRQGVSVKNAIIVPGVYTLDNYEKDQQDIEFLLEQDIAFLALSFVNDARDIENLQQFIRLTIKDRQEIKEKLCWMDNQELKFPIIAKIETEEGIAHLGDIMDASYGILVARGDLALRTGIETVGILQKDIIDKCVAEGKPAITATQMLLSMMDFIEPRRSEVTDVTNAVQDGSDALMLSEETADPDSKYPTESIRMMANIISKTEERRSSDRLDYKYEIDKQHEKALKSLKDDRIKLKEKLERHSMTAMQYDLEDQQFQRMENTEHVSYDACKTAFELKCKAIVVLTDTGGTARMVSRFGPDAPILAGVYKDRIARILRLSYGVETFRITSNPQGYPFAEFEAVIRQARDSGVLEEGDRVILVAGYPPKQPGTTTLLNIYEVGRTEDSIPSMASKRQ